MLPDPWQEPLSPYSRPLLLQEQVRQRKFLSEPQRNTSADFPRRKWGERRGDLQEGVLELTSWGLTLSLPGERWLQVPKEATLCPAARGWRV